MITDQRRSEIVWEFQRLCKGKECDTAQFALEELKAAHIRIGGQDDNEAYRKAMLIRIAELELQDQRDHEADKLREQRKHESKIRAWNTGVGFIAGIVATLAGQWLINL